MVDQSRLNAANDVTGFERVDAQSDPEYFIRFVDEVNAIPFFVVSGTKA